jgi:hypothetical protein
MTAEETDEPLSCPTVTTMILLDPVHYYTASKMHPESRVLQYYC